MSELSNYAENAVLNHLLRNVALTSPTTVYIALYSSDPTDANSGTELTVANGYAREAIAFDAPSNGVCLSTAEITFTASGAAWSAATHIGILDASTAGNLLLHTPLAASRTAADGDSIVFAANAVTVTLQ